MGLTVQEAKAIIQQNLFEVGLVESEDGKQDESDIVYYQDPAPFDVRDQGMQIDIWSSKKTPAEMGGKISELNAIYRIKLQDVEPLPAYPDPPVYREPEPRPVEPRQEVPKTETPKTETPKTEVSRTETSKPAADSKTKTTAPATTTKPAEKPKAKKVIVE